MFRLVSDRIYVIESPHDSSSGVFSDTPNSPEHHSAESGDSTNPAEHDRPPSYNSPNDDICPPPPSYTSGTPFASKSDYGSFETLEYGKYTSIPGQTIADNCTTPDDRSVSVDNGYECGRYNVRLSELIVKRVLEDNVGERHQTLVDGCNVGDLSTTQRTQKTCVSSETPIESNYASGTLGMSPCQKPVKDQCTTDKCEDRRMQRPCSPLSCRISDYGSQGTASRYGSHTHDGSQGTASRYGSHTHDGSQGTASRYGSHTHDAIKTLTADCVTQQHHTGVVRQPVLAPDADYSAHIATHSGLRCHPAVEHRGLSVADLRDAAQRRISDGAGRYVQLPETNEDTCAMRGGRVTNSRSSRGDACRRRVQRHRSPSTSSSCDSSDSSAMGCVTRHPSSGWSRDGGVVVTRPKRLNLTRKARSAQLARESDTYQRIYIKQRPHPPTRTSRWRQQCTDETPVVGYHSARSGDQSRHDDRPPFSRLPDSALRCVFSHLNSDVLCRCARVCRRWWRLAWSPTLWRYIRIEGATDATINVDKALKALTRRLSVDTPTVCVMVESICLTGDVHLTDKGLYTIARRCPELRSLDIHACADVTNIALFEVVSRCVNLEQLNVAGE